MACPPYQITTGCCDDWGVYPSDLRERATSLAWAAMRFLTAGLVGQCSVTVRPCALEPCSVCNSVDVPAPFVWGGDWYNAPRCSPKGCSCEPLSEVRLNGRVAEVVSVSLDGQPLVVGTDYVILDGSTLVRTGGLKWPACQDLAAANDAVGAFAVEYVPGVKPDAAGLWAAGVLACEFAKACSGDKCRLPSSVQTLSRQGVTMSFDNSLFSNGQTGIREVDAYTLSVNPHRLKTASTVFTPDMRVSRYSSGV